MNYQPKKFFCEFRFTEVCTGKMYKTFFKADTYTACIDKVNNYINTSKTEIVFRSCEVWTTKEYYRTHESIF